jgi:leucyl/phenylalanyl-tRNA--protein transferase
MHAGNASSLIQRYSHQVSAPETPEPTHPVDAMTTKLRVSLFRESPLHAARRIGSSAAYSLKNNGLRNLMPYWRRCLAEFVHPRTELPDPERPFDGDARMGLVHDLSVRTLIAAYEHGLYPAGHFGKLAWLSPPERCVLFLEETGIGKNVRRLMRQNRYRVTFDEAFERVVHACARPRRKWFHVTWLTPRIIRAYAALYDAGHVHSFEVWNEAGDLVGGGYGVALGSVFFTESQFSLESNTSKYGFAVLNWHLNKWGYRLNDGRNSTPTLLEAGFRVIPRSTFQQQLARLIHSDRKQGRWRVEVDAAQCLSLA